MFPTFIAIGETAFHPAFGLPQIDETVYRLECLAQEAADAARYAESERLAEHACWFDSMGETLAEILDLPEVGA